MKTAKLSLHNIPVFEHLEHTLKNTTYAQRLRWLEEARDFVRRVSACRAVRKR